MRLISAMFAFTLWASAVAGPPPLILSGRLAKYSKDLSTTINLQVTLVQLNLPGETTICTQSFPSLALERGVFRVGVDTSTCSLNSYVFNYLENPARKILVEFSDGSETFPRVALGMKSASTIAAYAGSVPDGSLNVAKFNISNVSECGTDAFLIYKAGDTLICSNGLYIPTANEIVTAYILDGTVQSQDIADACNSGAQTITIGGASVLCSSLGYSTGVTSTKILDGTVERTDFSGLSACSTNGQVITISGTGFGCTDLGDIEGVTAGVGMTGGALVGDVTIGLDVSTIANPTGAVQAAIQDCPAGGGYSAMSADGLVGAGTCVAALVAGGNLTFTGALVLPPAAPTLNDELANRLYVTSQIYGNARIATGINASKIAGTVADAQIPSTIAKLDRTTNFTGTVQSGGNNVLHSGMSGGANGIVVLDGAGRTQTLDGSNLTGITYSQFGEQLSGIMSASGVATTTLPTTIQYDQRVLVDSATVTTLQLPDLSSTTKDFLITVKNLTAAGLTVSAQGSQLIDGSATATLAGQYDVAVYRSFENNWTTVSTSTETADNTVDLAAKNNSWIIVDTTQADVSLNLPSISGADNGRSVNVKQIGGNRLQLFPNGAQTIDGDSSVDIQSRYAWTQVTAQDSRWWITNRARGVATDSKSGCGGLIHGKTNRRERYSIQQGECFSNFQTQAQHCDNGSLTDWSGDQVTYQYTTCNSGLVAWLSSKSPNSVYSTADCYSTLATNGSNVACWKDLSGNGNHGLANSSGNLPIYDTATFTDTSVRFTAASNNSMCFASLVPSEHLTVFIVLRELTTASQKRILTAYSGGALASGNLIIESRSGAIFKNHTDRGATFTAGGASAYTSSVSTFAYRAGDTASSLYVNGSTALDTQAYAAVSAGGSIRYCLGEDLGVGAAEYFDGHMLEVMIFNRDLSDTEMNFWGNYLESKYSGSGITAWTDI